MEISNSKPDTRSRILQAAIRVFSQKGFHNARVEEIATEAQVGKGTVYEYFSSKEELFYQLFKSCSDAYLKSLTQDLASLNSVGDRLEKIVYLHLKFIKNHRDIARIIFQEHHELGEKLHRWIWSKREEKLNIISNLLEEGIRKGELRAVNTRVAAQVFLGAVVSVGSTIAFAGDDVPLAETTTAIVEIFLKGVGR
ncbi:TetR/AcrR family transcriptional regulator [Calderihabitans maritimus]|uniref:Transcriptional regulator, TetR family n=1 Tax=Calderihabitans maritimus TaxID=1246530 RepID=A0A1Z5HT35_9FIRM|nr:TetR/AcrR family transcriptional regulator [Calderihabitans maritimus]GAW92430.1 transcriptional regulator, TetR family [Calderihabitans maritimus]